VNYDSWKSFSLKAFTASYIDAAQIFMVYETPTSSKVL